MRRFSIRDLFCLTLVVGMGLGWWVDRGKLTERGDLLLIEGVTSWDRRFEDGRQP